MGLFSKNKITPPVLPGKPAETKDFRVVGTQFECRKDPTRMRSNILKSMKLNNPVVLEYYEYKGAPAYMVVDCKSGLDIGTLQEGTAKYIKDCYPNAIFVGVLVEKTDKVVGVSINIYGERMVYLSMTRGHANVIYRAYKDKQITLSKKDISKMYEIADMNGEQPIEIVSKIRRAVEKIFEDDYVGANAILKDTFK